MMSYILYGVVSALMLLATGAYSLKIEEQHITVKSGVIILAMAVFWPVVIGLLIAILLGGLILYLCDSWKPTEGKVVIHSKRRAAREMADRMFKDQADQFQASTWISTPASQPPNSTP